jgi:hypothetical protein
MLDGRDDADDGSPSVCRLVRGTGPGDKAEPVADGIGTGKELRGQPLIHDDGFCAWAAVRALKGPAGNQVNANGLEERRRDRDSADVDGRLIRRW